MADPVDEFFEDLSGREFDARLETLKGTLSFDIAGPDNHGPWFVEVDRGRLKVSREPREADSVAHASRKEFNEIVTGRDSVMTAILRGALTVDGNLRLLLLFQRVLPTGAGARDPREFSNVGRGGERS